MSSSIATTCPFCLSQYATFTLLTDITTGARKSSLKPNEASAEAPAKCQGCGSLSILYFHRSQKVSSTETIPNHHRITTSKNYVYFFAGTQPKPAKAECPAHAPDPVERAFLDAEKSRLAGLFTPAAALYRKAVDRAVTPFVDEAFKSKMLGQKLGNLRNQQKLPDLMLEWIALVKDDGNYAMHDDDRDFDTPEEIEPARKFTIALLNYLFTMPEEIKEARTAVDARKANAS